MANLTFWFGPNGTENVWYLKTGTTGFTPIDISLLPGPKPFFSVGFPLVNGTVTGETFDDAVVYNKRVLVNTESGLTTLDHLPTWNVVKNLQIKSVSAQELFIDGFVHVDIQVGVNDLTGSTLFLNGVKRANVITGGGDDTIDIRVVSDQQSVWVDDYRVFTGAGKDVVRLAALDVAGELAAGDLTYIESVNKPGLPLTVQGEGRSSHIATGANDDIIVGYTSNDHFIAGTDDGSVQQVLQAAPPSGFAYSIGGATSKGHVSTLYKIELATGVTTAVGAVAVPAGKGKSSNNLDVESLTLNPNDGMLYGFVTSPGNVIGLIKVDPNTAATTYIGGNVGVYKSTLQDMAFDLAGNLYLASEGDLVKVNTTTGAASIVGDNTLSKKIGALAIDPLSGKMYAIAEEGSKTILSVIDKATGVVTGSSQIGNLAPNSKLEGASFDSAGTLWAVDRVSGGLFTINTGTSAAQSVSKTLAVSKQTGDGFESLAIAVGTTSQLIDLNSIGGDTITTGAGTDRIFYAAGDGVDVVTDFNAGTDKLYISGYAAGQVSVQTFQGDTFIRFKDNSADGFVDNAMIELSDVASFDPALIIYQSAEAFYM